MPKSTPTSSKPKNSEKAAVSDKKVDSKAAPKTATLPIAPNSQVKVSISWKTVEPAFQKALRKAATKVKLDGFRIGKAPLPLVERNVDQQLLIEQTLQIVLPEAYTAALKESKQRPITQPEIDPITVEKGKDWELNLYFAEAPVVSIKDYQNVIKKVKKDAEEAVKEVEKAEKVTDEMRKTAQLKVVSKALIQNLNPQIPELLVRQEVNHQLHKLVDQLKQLNIAEDDYLRSRQMTAESLRQMYAVEAVSGLQLEFILAEVAKEAKITVPDAELDEKLKEIFGADSDKISEENKQQYRSYLFSSLVKQKVSDHLLSFL